MMKRISQITIYVTVVFLAIPSLALAQAVISVHPAELNSPPVGAEFTLNVNITDGKNVGGYQFDIIFDPTALSFVDAENADYLPLGAFAIPPIVKGNNVTLGATSIAGAVSGDGTLAKVTFQVVEVKASTIGLTNVILPDPAANSLDVTSQDGKITIMNEAPVAVIEASPVARVGEAITLNGAKSTDDSVIVSYAWDFGDGTKGEGETVKHVYPRTGDFTVTLIVTDDGNPQALTGSTTLIVRIKDALQATITEHKPGTNILSLKATILNENTPAQCYVAIWEGNLPVERGIFLEYQVKFPQVSVHKMGGMFLHTDVGNVSGKVADSGELDWKHRQVSLNELAGQTIVAITLGADNEENPNNPAGPFSMMVDNVQITNGPDILNAIWVDQDSISAVQKVTNPFIDPVGVSNCEASVGADTVTVRPKGKRMTTWGWLKATK